MKENRLTALVLSAFLLAGCTAGGPGSASSSSTGSPTPPSGGGSVSATPSARPAVPSPNVRVDWSRLEGDSPAPQADVDGGRWFEGYTDRLITGENYGPLIPYIGEQAYSFNRWENEGEMQEYWSPWPTSFYGLMTREGKIVTDPVYQYAFPYSYQQGGESRALPVLLLARADPALKDFGNGRRYAVAAEDGSWCTEFEFLNYTNREDRLFLSRPEGCTILDSRTGVRRDWSWAELGISQEEVPDALEFVQWGIGLNWLDQGVCLGGRNDQAATLHDMPLRIFNPDTGEVSWVDYRQWDRWQSEYYDRCWDKHEDFVQENGQTSVIRYGRSYPLADAPEDCYLSYRQGDFAVLSSSEGGDYLYRLSTGERLLEGEHIHLAADEANPNLILPVRLAQGDWTVYNEALEPILTLPRISEENWMYFSLRDGLLCVRDDSTFFGYWDLKAEKYVFFRNLGLGD